MSLADVAAHQARHGFLTVGGAVGSDQRTEPKNKVPPSPVKMTIPEKEYSMILEAMKRRGEILEYRPWGIKLSWGVDPKTGRAMIYTPDFYVVRSEFRQKPYISDIVVIEVKGSKLYGPHLVRFRGCRAEWPMFSFELHQRDKDGTWRHVE